MPLAYTSGSVKGSDVLLEIKNRLVEGLNDDVDNLIDESFVRIVATPSPNFANYRAERGVAIRFSPPQPFTPAGASRWGLPVTRNLEVHICSMNLLDPAQNDEKAVLAHLDMEEAIVDILHDPSPVPTVTHIGLKVRWIPGGAEIERQIKKEDPALLLSVILFEVTYVAHLRVDAG